MIHHLSCSKFVVLAALSLHAASDALGGPKEPPSQITPEAVRAVKHATVHLKVKMGGKQEAEGSGFFAVEPGLVVTNAHVVGMLRANSKPPAKITAVLHSGESDETEVTAKLLGVDRINDLALLRVEGKLPAPLQFGRDDELAETQKVYIFGFPFGSDLGKDITVSESSISSLRKDASGALDKVQVNGGMHPGNSGGPVVNPSGKVIGVSVSGILATQINFAIPARQASALLDGRLLAMTSGEPFRDQAAVRLPLRCECLDPLKRIKEVRAEVWAGKPAANRKFSTTKAQPETGDGTRQSQALKYANDAAAADVPLPKLAEGEVAWVQPIVLLANGQQQWGAPQAFAPGLPLDRLPVDLAIKLADRKESTIHLILKHNPSSGGFSFSESLNAELDILESFTPNAKEVKLKTGFSIAKLSRGTNGKNEDVPPDAPKLLQHLAPVYFFDGSDTPRRLDVNFNPMVPYELAQQAYDFRSLIVFALEATNFVLPNRLVQAGETWEARLPMLPMPGTQRAMIDLVLSCKYEGLRERSGNREALVTFTGRMKSRDPKDDVEPEMVGRFTYDPTQRIITSARMTVGDSTDSDGPFARNRAVEEIELTRVMGNPAKIELLVRPAENLPVKVEPKEETLVEGSIVLKAPFSKAQAEKTRAAWAKHLNVPERKELDLGKGVKMEVVLIPPGEFVMGVQTGGRKVTISKPFYIAVTETTQEQYEAVTGSNPSGFSAKGQLKDRVTGLDTAKFPVEGVMWEEALDFAAKLKAQLPTDAQWEYACRAGTTTVFHFGDVLVGVEANCDGRLPAGSLTTGPYLQRTAKVGSYTANAFGLYDMHGNVAEYAHPIDRKIKTVLELETPPLKPTLNPIFRGGSWRAEGRACQFTWREGVLMTARLAYVGVRVVVPIPDQAVVVTPKMKDGAVTKIEPKVEAKVEPKLPIQPKDAASQIEEMLNAIKAKDLAELTIESARFLAVKDGLDDKKKKVFVEPPSWLAERSFHFKSSQAGYTQFKIEKDGIVMLAVSPNFQGGGNASGNWKPECVSREEFLAAGWREAGTLRVREADWPFYWRECKKGESFKYRTEKYAAPIIIK